LAQPEFRQLKQRVSLKCSIKMLSPHDTAEYIRWRLRVAGARDEGLFDTEAIQLTHQFSGGIPRIINNICDNALLTGFSEGSPRITGSIIAEVVEALDLTSIEVVSQHTIAESIAELNMFDSQESYLHPASGLTQQGEKHAAPNVSYIRREGASANDKARFVINSDADREEPLKFFSRVRVTRNS
jgi:hypothetical protein